MHKHTLEAELRRGEFDRHGEESIILGRGYGTCGLLVGGSVAAISSLLSVEAGGVDGRLVRASKQAAEGQRLREVGWGREASCSTIGLVLQCVQEESLCGRIAVRGSANWVEDDAGEAAVFQESGC